MNTGVCSDRELEKFVTSGVISIGEFGLDEGQIQPSSFDLRVGGHFYCLPYSVLPPAGSDLPSFFNEISKYDFHIKGGEKGFLHKGNVYVVKLQEGLSLPHYIMGKANPKSSIGRIDLHVRLITEDGKSFDSVPSGYSGALWLELSPRSFDIEISFGETLSQLMLMDNDVDSLSSEELLNLYKLDPLLLDAEGGRLDDASVNSLIHRNFVGMRVHVGDGVVAYVARTDAPPIDLSRRDLPASQYFSLVYGKDGELVVNPESFYILSSKEMLFVPEMTCAEMIDVDTGFGEFRGHYAGFFDPGFKSQAVLELRNYGMPFVLRDGQLVSGLKYFAMRSRPATIYGSEGMGSSYQGQALLKLAKYFDMYA
jgi:dCTP deaminase